MFPFFKLTVVVCAVSNECGKKAGEISIMILMRNDEMLDVRLHPVTQAGGAEPSSS